MGDTKINDRNGLCRPFRAPFFSDPYRGFAALTSGYYLSPLRCFKNYAALGVSPAFSMALMEYRSFENAENQPARRGRSRIL